MWVDGCGEGWWLVVCVGGCGGGIGGGYWVLLSKYVVDGCGRLTFISQAIFKPLLPPVFVPLT